MSSTIKPEPRPIVHVVDDDESLRTAVARLLRIAGYEVRTYASAGPFLLARPELTPGCVVLDIRMPGTNGLEIQDAFRQHGEFLPIIFLTGHGDIPLSVRAMKMGAVDFLTKPVKREVLLSAVQMALARDAETRATRERLRQCRDLFASLTPREREVFGRVVVGQPNKQIAAEIGTVVRTVKAHRARVMEKMHVASLAELVQVAELLHAAAPSSASHRVSI
jgi:FixJ family two-component response regulator